MGYENIEMLLPLSGANEGTLFPDFSRHNRSFTASGGVQTVTEESKFYGSATKFVRDNSTFLQTTGLGTEMRSKWRFSGWFYATFTADNNGLIYLGDPSSNNLRIQIDVRGTNKQLQLYTQGTTGNDSVFTPVNSLVENTWTHFLVACNGGSTAKIWLNGVESGSGPVISNTTAGTLRIGAVRAGGVQQHFTGYMQDIEFVRGEDWPSTDFTPPPRRIGTISNSALTPIRDASGDTAVREVIVLPESGDEPIRQFKTTSDSAGLFEVQCPVEPSWVIGRDPDGTYNDKIRARILPQ
jgi:hypothetical protein